MLSIANEYSLSISGLPIYLYIQNLYIQIINSKCRAQIHYFNNDSKYLENYNSLYFFKETHNK